MIANLEPAVGRYVQLEFNGKTHRVYFEEAGQGIPLLCLHTAGADGRQYRSIINDQDILQNFRVIVPDMPWHGKSSPPEGWQNETWLLTTEQYLEFIVSFMAALDIRKPVVMGCSIGGRVVLHLALRHSDRISAVIGLQSGLHAETGEFPDENMMQYLHVYNVHGGEASAGSVAGLIAPQSPDKERWETLWHYASGGPGVFRGDLFYYFVDGDLRNQQLNIDTRNCPVFLLSGEYDFSAPAAGAAEIAERIPGSHFTEMKGLGHFPMSENPPLFKRYLMPVLAQLTG
jgi:pimeloyl-ACP methyl ester carboxylesterase